MPVRAGGPARPRGEEGAPDTGAEPSRELVEDVAENAGISGRKRRRPCRRGSGDG